MRRNIDLSTMKTVKENLPNPILSNHSIIQIKTEVEKIEIDLTTQKSTENPSYNIQIETENKNIETDLKQTEANTQPLSNSIKMKQIDLSKCKKLFVRIDPQTQRFISKDGRKIDMKSKSDVAPTTQEETAKICKKMRNLPTNMGINSIPTPTNIIKTKAERKYVPKYHVVDVLSLNRRKSSEFSVVRGSQIAVQTETVATMTESKYFTKEESVQVDRDTDSLINFILGEETENESVSKLIKNNEKRIDVNNLKTKEEIAKFRFFCDMNQAMKFDGSGNLPIHQCTILNKLQAVQQNSIILKAINESVDILNKSHNTALHLAIIYGSNDKIVSCLLNYGADVSLPDTEGNTSLHLAIKYGRASHLKNLLQIAIDSKINIDSFNHEGFTPLILGCFNESLENVKLLLNNGADPNVRDLKSGRTALFHSVELLNVNLVDLLIEHKADTRLRNFFGTSPHDAMFEIEELPVGMKRTILGREHFRLQQIRRSTTQVVTKESIAPVPIKKRRIQTKSVLHKITSTDLSAISSKKNQKRKT